jgi:lysine biosynthesis protein LysW
MPDFVTQLSYCPDCDFRIRFHKPPQKGQLVKCPECGVISEVVSTNPVELDWAENEDTLVDKSISVTPDQSPNPENW